MSNASAASRAATKQKASTESVNEPELPFDHPERLTAALFEESKENGITWQLPMVLNQRLPFAQFGVSIDHLAGVILVSCSLPLAAPTVAEQSRYRLGADVPRLELHITARVVQTAISALLTHGIADQPLDAIARIVGQAIADTQSPPRGARPFIDRWMANVRELSSTLSEMWWQSTALDTSRDAVHRARKLLREQSQDVLVQWIGGLRAGARHE